ncbi:DUF1853 family protein [Tenacibaculum sp. SG-28]|uniref:DUF1853 family protein n=1 Tax=Tenacibaculum sp. SG-28 TaxID=754426 RepID=UPI000CF450B2|nr:DUF1853 family protein [Tenacibaculum sp. SG-28]PQJ23464.1 hypothetical protein BSU00_04605 [Tenacibaculum sp. SG-28]
MYAKLKTLQLQYQGFTKTPFLWHGKGVFGLEQYEHVLTKSHSFNTTITEKLPLGKLAERFVFFELKKQKAIRLLLENIQIQREKITLGELDCIFQDKNQVIHLEIVYKFYLYNSSIGNSEIAHWIGPNKKDTLLDKLKKLKQKQFPLIAEKECIESLQKQKISTKNIQQRVYFKAQLFLPLGTEKKTYQHINNKCISGFYCNAKALHSFDTYKFYIPAKLNWFVTPHTQVSWLDFYSFNKQIENLHSQKKSPLCWVKKRNGELLKLFVVWW